MVSPAPTGAQWEQFATALSPLLRINQPMILGSENLSKEGSLYVGNHTLYGFLDLPFMVAEIWSRYGVTVRGLGDNAHYNFPGWRNLLERCGMVRGTRENVHELMDLNQNVLVFPGGSREVNKRRGEKYRLMWKERIGFAKIAIEHGYPIIPFAAVGAEEMFDVLLDEHNLLYARFSSLVQRITGWPIHTIVKGMGPTLIPRPERLYFWFGKPIQTSDLEGKASTSNAKAIRDHVKAEIETGIDTLLRIRESDPHRHISTRILSDAR